MQRVRIVSAAAIVGFGLVAFALTRLGPLSWVTGGDSARRGAAQDDVDWGGAVRKPRGAKYLGVRGGGSGHDDEPGRPGEEGPVGKRAKRARSVFAGRVPRAGVYVGDSASRGDRDGESSAWFAGGADFDLTAREPRLGGAAGSPPNESTDEPEEPREEEPNDGAEDVVFQVPLNRQQGTLATDSTAPITEQNVTYPEKGDGVRFGPDSILAFPNAGNLRGDAGTLSLDIRPEWDGDAEGDYSLVNVRTPDDPSNMLRVYKNGAYLRYIFSDDTGQERDVGVDISEWEAGDRHSVTVTWGDSSTALYVDRRLVGQNTYDGRLQIPFGTPLYVGSDVPQAPPTGAGGVISNLRVYGKALGGDVIAAAQ